MPPSAASRPRLNTAQTQCSDACAPPEQHALAIWPRLLPPQKLLKKFIGRRSDATRDAAGLRRDGLSGTGLQVRDVRAAVRCKPLLRRIETFPPFYCDGQVDFVPFRVVWRLLKLLDLGKERVD